MDLLAREQIKILLAQEKLNQKELAAMILQKKQEKYAFQIIFLKN